MEPEIELSRGSVKIKIKNLSFRDYQTIIRYKPRIEDYLSKEFSDATEGPTDSLPSDLPDPDALPDPDTLPEPENLKDNKLENTGEEDKISEFKDVKYYKETEDDVDFYDREGKPINYIIVQNRVINIKKINKSTRILYKKILNPIPEKLENKIEKPEVEPNSLKNKIVRKTQNTIDKIKDSLGKFIPSLPSIKNNEEEGEISISPVKEEEIKPVRKRTLKNNYTFHRIPHRKMKNTTIPKKSSKTKKLKKELEKKIKKRSKSLGKMLINTPDLHQIRTR